MKKHLAIAGLALIIGMAPLTSVKAEGSAVPLDKEIVKQQIDKDRIDQVKFHLNELAHLNKTDGSDYLSEFGIEVNKKSISASESTYNNESVKDEFENLLDNAYIYTMDDNGFVYDKNGEVVNKVDINEQEFDNSDSISLQAYVDPTIGGSDTGAFARQVTSTGYKGIRTSFVLPSSPAINTPNSVSGYLYNGIDVLSSLYPDGYKIEGGVQYSQAKNDYQAIIRPKGLTQNPIPDGYSSAAPRYKAGTSIISNILYDTTTSKFKYFVNGTNVNGVNQYILFTYGKSLSNSEISNLAVKRVTALAKNDYSGGNIGKVTVNYSSTEVTRLDGTTTQMTQGMLSSHNFGGKIHGTSDTPSGAVSKSGSVSSQTVSVNTVGF
ncbi:hypothetical protein KSP24_07760 [Paenibacillus sp. AK121]|uniref:hypothetical protein n=1 Tax=unclassified Paenibacillus TaxID=185978 RepID=UPI000C801C4D|nr:MULTISPECIES: hypothetical protein [unclassified Paenibacillus]AUO05293.1 hypothetical protein C0638_01250 [Paenibacillus sp. lzh-N1]MBU9706824.1 hypothetical protein [Paenibacillus sp. AK121]